MYCRQLARMVHCHPLPITSLPLAKYKGVTGRTVSMIAEELDKSHRKNINAWVNGTSLKGTLQLINMPKS